MLGISAGLTGILIAMWAPDLARLVVPARLVPLEALALDGRVLAFTACVSLLTSVVFGVLPALFGTDIELTDAMRGDPRSGGMSRSRHLVRRVLTAAEVAIAVILLVGAGLLVRSFVQLQRIPLWFDPSGTIAVTIDLPEGRYADDEQTRQSFDRLMEGASGLPGVTAVARATGLPPDSGLILGTMRVQGRPGSEGHWPSTLSGSTVSDAYLDVMRISLRQGGRSGRRTPRRRIAWRSSTK